MPIAVVMCVTNDYFTDLPTRYETVCPINYFYHMPPHGIGSQHLNRMNYKYQAVHKTTGEDRGPIKNDCCIFELAKDNGMLSRFNIESPHITYCTVENCLLMIGSVR